MYADLVAYHSVIHRILVVRVCCIERSLMQHRSIGHYSPSRYSPTGSVRVNGIYRMSSCALVSDYKRYSEQRPEPLVLSDVVWRATKAVEESDRRVNV